MLTLQSEIRPLLNKYKQILMGFAGYFCNDIRNNWLHFWGDLDHHVDSPNWESEYYGSILVLWVLVLVRCKYNSKSIMLSICPGWSVVWKWSTWGSATVDRSSHMLSRGITYTLRTFVCSTGITLLLIHSLGSISTDFGLISAGEFRKVSQLQLVEEQFMMRWWNRNRPDM